MAGLNRVTLIGRVGKDPEIRSLQNGGKVATFSLATSEQWKDRNSGERKEVTDWHNIVIFNEGLVSVVERFVKKGSLIHVDGALKTRKWQDQSGNDRYTTEVVLRPFRGELTLLDSASGERGEGRSNGGRNEQQGGGRNEQRSGGGYDPQPDLDDEIPF